MPVSFSCFLDFLWKTSKFDWTPDDIRIEKISNEIFPLLIK